MKNNQIYTYLVVQILVLFFIAITINQSFAVQSQRAVDESTEKIFYGRWKTDSGSLYEYVNGAMICISVHNNNYRGWINKVAIKNFRLKDDGWYVDQAIRFHDTGRLSRWVTAKIEILNESSFAKTVLGSTASRPQLWTKVH